MSERATENNLCELIRGVAGDLVEEVRLLDTFTNAKTVRLDVLGCGGFVVGLLWVAGKERERLEDSEGRTLVVALQRADANTV